MRNAGRRATGTRATDARSDVVERRATKALADTDAAPTKAVDPIAVGWEG